MNIYDIEETLIENRDFYRMLKRRSIGELRNRFQLVERCISVLITDLKYMDEIKVDRER